MTATLANHSVGRFGGTTFLQEILFLPVLGGVAAQNGQEREIAGRLCLPAPLHRV